MEKPLVKTANDKIAGWTIHILCRHRIDPMLRIDVLRTKLRGSAWKFFNWMMTSCDLCSAQGWDWPESTSIRQMQHPKG